MVNYMANLARAVFFWLFVMSSSCAPRIIEHWFSANFSSCWRKKQGPKTLKIRQSHQVVSGSHSITLTWQILPFTIPLEAKKRKSLLPFFLTSPLCIKLASWFQDSWQWRGERKLIFIDYVDVPGTSHLKYRGARLRLGYLLITTHLPPSPHSRPP